MQYKLISATESPHASESINYWVEQGYHVHTFRTEVVYNYVKYIVLMEKEQTDDYFEWSSN